MAPEDTNPQSSHRRTRSTSRSRPTTPLRPSSRSSFRSSARGSVYGDNAAFPLNAFEPAFAELADAVADLEANMMHFQLMHESLARFSESFASFLYGLNMNAFCVDFPEGPITESFKRMKLKEEEMQANASKLPERTVETEPETTFMTTDTSFVENPPSHKQAPKYQAPGAATRQSRLPPPSTRVPTSVSSSSRAGATRGGRGGPRGAQASGLPTRARGRGVR